MTVKERMAALARASSGGGSGMQLMDSSMPKKHVICHTVCYDPEFKCSWLSYRSVVEGIRNCEHVREY